jgi:hypothetical protein
LCRKCKPQLGEYWSMISHIKHISIKEKWSDWPWR